MDRFETKVMQMSVEAEGWVVITLVNGTEMKLQNITTFIDDGFVWGQGFNYQGKPILFNVGAVASVKPVTATKALE